MFDLSVLQNKDIKHAKAQVGSLSIHEHTVILLGVLNMWFAPCKRAPKTLRFTLASKTSN